MSWLKAVDSVLARSSKRGDAGGAPETCADSTGTSTSTGSRATATHTWHRRGRSGSLAERSDSPDSSSDPADRAQKFRNPKSHKDDGKQGALPADTKEASIASTSSSKLRLHDSYNQTSGTGADAMQKGAPEKAGMLVPHDWLITAQADETNFKLGRDSRSLGNNNGSSSMNSLPVSKIPSQRTAEQEDKEIYNKCNVDDFPSGVYSDGSVSAHSAGRNGASALAPAARLGLDADNSDDNERAVVHIFHDDEDVDVDMKEQDEEGDVTMFGSQVKETGTVHVLQESNRLLPAWDEETPGYGGVLAPPKSPASPASSRSSSCSSTSGSPAASHRSRPRRISLSILDRQNQLFLSDPQGSSPVLSAGSLGSGKRYKHRHHNTLPRNEHTSGAYRDAGSFGDNNSSFRPHKRSASSSMAFLSGPRSGSGLRSASGTFHTHSRAPSASVRASVSHASLSVTSTPPTMPTSISYLFANPPPLSLLPAASSECMNSDSDHYWTSPMQTVNGTTITVPVAEPISGSYKQFYLQKALSMPSFDLKDEDGALQEEKEDSNGGVGTPKKTGANLDVPMQRWPRYSASTMSLRSGLLPTSSVFAPKIPLGNSSPNAPDIEDELMVRLQKRRRNIGVSMPDIKGHLKKTPTLGPARDDSGESATDTDDSEGGNGRGAPPASQFARNMAYFERLQRKARREEAAATAAALDAMDPTARAKRREFLAFTNRLSFSEAEHILGVKLVLNNEA